MTTPPHATGSIFSPSALVFRRSHRLPTRLPFRPVPAPALIVIIDPVAAAPPSTSSIIIITTCWWWCSIMPPLALDLFRRLLCLSPYKRLTAAEALRHPYFMEGGGVLPPER